MKVTALAAVVAVVLAGCGAHSHSHSHSHEHEHEHEHRTAHTLALTTRVSPAVSATCTEAARATRIRVVCPPVVPADGVGGGPADSYGPQVTGPNEYTMSFNNGQVPGHIHWEAGAGTLAGIAAAEFDERNWDAPAPKQPPRVIGGDRCAGYLIAIYRFPENDGQLEGHDVALATAAGITYFASVHGYAHDDADVAMLLAILLSARGDHVTRVWPAAGACRAVVAK
jgi:hypothetical protein